jgi:hypothetical protein
VEVLQLSRSDLDRALGQYKDTVKAQMRSRAQMYTSSGERTSVTQAEEKRAKERKQELRRTFDDIDVDGSGSIDRCVTHTLTHSLTHSHSLSLSLTHSLTHSLSHSLTHSLTHSLSHSLTHTHAHAHAHTSFAGTSCG